MSVAHGSEVIGSHYQSRVAHSHSQLHGRSLSHPILDFMSRMELSIMHYTFLLYTPEELLCLKDVVHPNNCNISALCLATQDMHNVYVSP